MARIVRGLDRGKTQSFCNLELIGTTRWLTLALDYFLHRPSQ